MCYEAAMALPDLPPEFARWFKGRGWTPHAHQIALIAAARERRSVLLTAPTGGGKTLAGFLPSLIALAESARARASTRSISRP